MPKYDQHSVRPSLPTRLAGFGAPLKRMSRPIERITQAAIQIFREQGVNAARLEDIARAAKLSRPNLYRYIHDRDDLIRLVILQRANFFRHELRIGSNDWADALTELIIKVVRLCAEDEIFMLMINEAEPSLAKLFNDDDTIRTALNKVILPLLVKGRAAGQIRDDLNDDEILLWLHYQTWSLARDPKIQKALDVKTIAKKFVVGGLMKFSEVRVLTLEKPRRSFAKLSQPARKKSTLAPKS